MLITMNRRKRQKRETRVELNITAFMNLMVVLVPFLLMTAVFANISVLDLKLPGMNSTPAQSNKKPEFELQVTVRKDRLELSDTQGGLIKKIPVTRSGHNYVLLNQTLRLIKFKFPEKRRITILSEPYTSYETIVELMDTVREYQTLQDNEVVALELFPDVSIGDAARI